MSEDADEPLTHAIFKQIYALAAQTNVAFAELLTELDLTEALANVLWHLDPRASPPSMRALAATLNCDPSTVTFLTDRLEQRGLTQRQASPTDRRIKVITLTPQGTRARAGLVQAVATRSPLARLSPDEQQHLHALLAKTGVTPVQTVLLIPHRAPGVEEAALPPEYRRILAAVRNAGGPVATRQVGEALGLDTGVRGKLEPLRGKLGKLSDRGWLRKLPDGRFTTRP